MKYLNMNTISDMTKIDKKKFQRTDESTSMRHYRLAYAGLYDMGMEARRLKNLRSVNGTVFLLDSTLHRYHDPATNSHLQESETVSTFD